VIVVVLAGMNESSLDAGSLSGSLKDGRHFHEIGARTGDDRQAKCLSHGEGNWAEHRLKLATKVCQATTFYRAFYGFR
jgi:hypothetical protein